MTAYMQSFSPVKGLGHARDNSGMTSPTEFVPGLTVQGITPPLNLRDFMLIAFDLQSTLINI